MRRPFLLALALLLPLPAFAWDGTGHMMVAAIAYDRLTPRARMRADALLRRNPDYRSWTRGVAAADRARIAFLQASTWADAIKGRSGYSDAGVDPDAPDATRITGYADKHEHRAWHFIDIAFSPDGTPVPPPPRANVQSVITAASATLRATRRPAGARSYALTWLLHLVGDIHQPLHAAERVTAREPKGDRGGNEVTVCTTTCGRKLHAVWDDLLGAGVPVGTVTARARALPPAPAAEAAISDPAVWAQESNALARRIVYAPPVREDGQPSQLDTAYLDQAKETARAQVALAGARLAALLNAALK